MPKGVLPTIAINGMVLNSTDLAVLVGQETQFIKSIKGLVSCYETLKPSISPFPAVKGHSIEFKTCTKINYKMGFAYQVTCVGVNKPYSVRKNFLVKVSATFSILR